MGKRFKRSLDLFFDMDKEGDSKMDKVMTYFEVCNMLNELYEENLSLKKLNGGVMEDME
jgi:hypothetical protein